MATLKAPFALDRSLNTTEVTPRNIADVLAEGLSHITGRTASEVEYDNSESGLTSDDVQGAIDELSERPTLPTTDIQTAVDEFETYNGGLLSECKVALSPNQDLHGYDSPWVGGASKNLLLTTVSNIKAINSGSWSGNVCTVDGVEFEVLTDDADNVLGIKVTRKTASSNNVIFNVASGADLSDLSGKSLIINGAGTDSSGDMYLQFYLYDGTNAISPPTGGDSAVFTANPNANSKVRIVIRTVANPNGVVFRPMIRLSTESDATFAPYSNICPISGHTQVDVDVSDGQTTQEQVTVNLGGTYYSGTLDVVSGVFTPDTAGVVFDGSENWQIHPSDTSAFFFVTVSTMTSTSWSYVQSEVFKDVYRETDARNNDCSIWSRYQQIHIHAPSSIVPSGISNEGLAEFKAWLSNNPQKVVYKLATPTPIQLSPTMVKALVGENHLSAPLDGQEITESKYRELFTWDEVESYVNAHIGGGSGMNYSTNEQVIGTWIDSKPLYQKTITHSGALTVDNTFSNDIGTLANVDQFVKCEGYFRRTDANGLMYSLNGGTRPEDGADSYKVTTRFFNGQVQVAVKGYIDIEYIALTVQYTKTTD